MNQKKLALKIKNRKQLIKNLKNSLKDLEQKLDNELKLCKHIGETKTKIETYESEYDGFIIEETTICCICNKIIDVKEL